MKATIQSTDQIVAINGSSGPPLHQTRQVMARVWEGVSEGGVRFTAYIPIVQVASKDDNAEFERELSECKPPDASTLRAIDMRFII